MSNDMLLVSIPCDTIALLLDVRRGEEDGVAAVIERLARSHVSPVLDECEPDLRPLSEPVFRRPRGKYRYEFLGEEGAADTLGGFLVDVLQRFAELDSGFLEKFSKRRGRTRRYLSRCASEIYPGREDLRNLTAEVGQGWWVGTNYSRIDVRRLLRAACEIAGLKWNLDLMVNL